MSTSLKPQTPANPSLSLKANQLDDTKIAASFVHLSELFGEDLAAQQLAIEHESFRLGEKRFKDALDNKAKRGELADHTVTKPLLDVLCDAVTEGVQAFNDLKQRGRPHVAKPWFAMLPAEKVAFIAVKTCLIKLGEGRDITLQKMCRTLGNNLRDEIRYGRLRDAEMVDWPSTKRNLEKRIGATYKREFLKAVENKLLTEEHIEPAPDMPDDVAYNVGIRMLEIIIETTSLVLIETRHGFKASDDKVLVWLSESYAEKLAKRAQALSGLAPVFQPTVVPPKPWTDVRGGGYYADGMPKLTLIRGLSKRALKRYRDVDMPDVYEAVNTIQNTPWRINSSVLDVVNNIMVWDKPPIQKMPQADKLDKPTPPTEEEAADAALLKRWKRRASLTYKAEKGRASRRLRLEFTVQQANHFADKARIYFPHNLDWRGRVNAVPMFSPQGDDLTKGLLHFADGLPLGAEGAKWLAIHGANTAGVDKVSLEDRVQWVHDNEAMILACAEYPLDCLEWCSQDSPFCFLAFCFDWAGYVASGRSEDYVSHTAVAFDGTCSGLQHFSAMLRDEIGGAAVNLLPADRPQDVYGLVAQKVNAILEQHVINGTEDELAERVNKKTGEIVEYLKRGTKALAAGWLRYGVTRSVTKRNVMTLSYGSKKFGFSSQILEDTINPAIEAGGEFVEIFDSPSQFAQYLASLIWDAVSTTVVAAVEGMNWLQKAAYLVSAPVLNKETKEVLKPAMPVHWTTPNGFPVWSEYRAKDTKFIDCIILGTRRFRVAMTMGFTDIDARKQSSGIAPNFIHSMDASHLQLTAIHCKRKYNIVHYAMIHDSFGTHAGRAGKLFIGVRETMVNTYKKHDVIQEFYDSFESQLHESQLGKMPALPSKGNLDLDKILESDFTFS